ncbi:hypothetical protein LQW54_001979 [Pestalotiopsis sp. IQ-011]
MGKTLLENYKKAEETVKSLDDALRQLSHPPNFSLFDELTQIREASALRRPEFSQPLVTALQIAYVDVLSSFGIQPQFAVGHSSGEIAAVYAGGFVSAEAAIKLAYLRGLAVNQAGAHSDVGMLAVGLPLEALREYIDPRDDAIQVACYNSPNSITISGKLEALETLRSTLENAGHFARLLQVAVAYHSSFMYPASAIYGEMLQEIWDSSFDQEITKPRARVFSSVTGAEMTTAPDISYWQRNLVSKVEFEMAVRQMIQPKTGPNVFIEVGPSSTLSSPLQEIFRGAADHRSEFRYTSVARRGHDINDRLYSVLGLLFGLGVAVDIAAANQYETDKVAPNFLTDLPNYAWNHSQKYWNESLASKDWRQRPFVRHDLLGSKVLGTNWSNPTWKNKLQLEDLPWLMDHRIGDQVVFPASGYICMAVEAMYQANFMGIWKGTKPEECVFRLRDAKFSRALVMNASESTTVSLSLAPIGDSDDSWYKFRVSSMKSDTWHQNASGLVRIDSGCTEFAQSATPIAPLENPTSAKEWYNDVQENGMCFGPAFQTHLSVEYASGSRNSRSIVSVAPPASKWQQSRYALHPVCMDGCFQAASFVLAHGDICDTSNTMVPLGIEQMALPISSQRDSQAIALASTEYSGEPFYSS